MLKNYFKIAFRNIRKQKLYSLINIFGLTLGITCCILIYLFIQDEYSYDGFHENADNIYRIEQIRYQKLKSDIEPTPFFDSRFPEGKSKTPWLPLPLGPTISDLFPEIKQVVRTDESNLIVRNETLSYEQDILLVDPSFFEVFTFPLLKGSAENVLSDPRNLVLTPETAHKYFGDEDPMGQTLAVTIQNEEHVFTVTGIAEAPPSNSSLPFSMVARIENKPFYDFNIERWTSFNTPIFVQLNPGADIEQFTKKLNDLAEERYAENWQGSRDRLGLPEEAPIAEFVISPLTGIHLDAAAEWYNVSNPLYSYILGTIAVLILIIACINYITLALARSAGRAKEVGIRKASGAHRSQIALQFWGETQLLTLFAMLAGVCIAELSLPFFNAIAGKSLSINYFTDAGFLAILLGITFTTGLIAGSYPALILSRFQPVKVLKGLSVFQFKPRLTKGLLVAQFSLSIFLIISSLIMYKQLDYVSGKELGYNEEQVLFVSTFTGFDENGTKLMERYRDELASIPGIKNVSGMAPAFTKGSNVYGFGVDGEMKESFIYFVDTDLANTLGIELVAGRNFSKDRPADITESIIVNEALVESMGWEKPVGEQLPWKGEENPSTIIGVVKNFHFQSMESEIKPMLFHMDPDQGGITDIAIKIEEGMIAETLPKLEASWKKAAPFTPFNYWFLDDAVARQYEQYQQWLQIMGVSTLMAILIACLGLFGLAGLTAVNKTKEIGIRKVLGAGISQIIFLLNKGIVKLILMSIIIAAPLSWYVMEQWLSDFAYSIEIGAGLFFVTGIATLLIALITVSYYSIKAAMVNPVDSLRSE
ncbi:MAG: FtsX-like permease family protein [Balneolaceae bacterium]|nr:FtsX-like permease family protein [Balneolaceae bacterium]